MWRQKKSNNKTHRDNVAYTESVCMRKRNIKIYEFTLRFTESVHFTEPTKTTIQPTNSQHHTSNGVDKGQWL